MDVRDNPPLYGSRISVTAKVWCGLSPDPTIFRPGKLLTAHMRSPFVFETSNECEKSGFRDRSLSLTISLCEGRGIRTRTRRARSLRSLCATGRIRTLRAFSRLSRSFDPENARGGIRTHGPLRERILSPPPLSRLGHPRAVETGERQRVCVSVGNAHGRSPIAAEQTPTNRQKASHHRSDRARSPRSSADRSRE